MGEPIKAYLDGDEWRLILALRDLPPSPLRDRLWELLRELVAFVQQPACAEMQADGVPCENPQAACDQCLAVTALLEGLRTRLQAASQA